MMAITQDCGFDMKSPGKQFQGARVQTLVSVANASGWAMKIAQADELLGGGVFFYVHDHQTGKIWVCQIAKTTFHQVRQELKDVAVDQAVGNVGRLLATGMENPESNSLDWENELGLSLTAYITKTKTYGLTQNASLTSHFVCIHYGKTSLIRPFALDGNDRFLLPTDTVVNAIQGVIAMDRQSHPEWIG